jgi:hypothetical protein
MQVLQTRSKKKPPPGPDGEDRLLGWASLLVENQDYRARLARLGHGAIREQFEDPSTGAKRKPDPLVCMQHFRAAIKAEVFPDTHVLIYVANCFARYLEAKGGVSLDQAFDLRSTPKAGNPSQSLATQEARDRLCHDIDERCKLSPGMSVTKVAELVLTEQGIDEIDADSAARYLRKWRLDLRPDDVDATNQAKSKKTRRRKRKKIS